MDQMDVIYSNYLTFNQESAYSPSRSAAWIKDNVFDRYRMKPVLRHLRDGSNVLEIGAGSGRLLRLLKKLSGDNIHLYANDLFFDEETRAGFTKDGVNILRGPIEACEVPEKFDAVIGIHVIEHVLDPRAVFQWAFDHMTSGAVLYFETPDAEALCRFIFKNKWGMTHFPRHMNLFTKKHLASVATQSGFKVIRHGNATSAPAWNMSIRNCLKMDALSKHNSVFDIFNYSNKVTLTGFTLLDLLLIAIGVPTSSQQLIAIRE